MFESIRIAGQYIAHPRHGSSYGYGSAYFPIEAVGARSRLSASTSTYGSGY
jgi:hypothetical protein